MSEYNLKNKIAVITGGASLNGIGFAIAEEFLEKEANMVILIDIAEIGIETADHLNSKYGFEKAVFMKCDVTRDVDSIADKIFQKYKKVDILVNSVGVINEDSIRKTMEVNAIAVIEWTMKFYEHMSKEKEGTIMNISSNYGFQIDQFAPFYKASKFALVGFSQTLGHEVNYVKSGVRVFVLCPGFTKTNFGHGPGNTGVKEEGWDKFLKNVIRQDPNAVGKAAVFVFEHAQTGTAWLVENGKWTKIVVPKVMY